FEKIMTRASGGVDYSQEEKLYYRNDSPDKSTDQKCEFIMIDKNLCEGECESGEADYIAERIIKLVGTGYKFKDIAILTRSVKNKAAEIEKALKLRNIPYFTDGGKGQFESLEIGILTTMLKVIDNPMQDIELASLLRSPIFGFDENLLARIRLEKKGPFYGALIKYSAGAGEGAQLCRDFLNTLSVWRDKVLFTPVDEFIEYIISASGLDVFAISLPGGEQRAANLKMFVLQARILQNSGFKGLFAFVSYIDRLTAGGDGAEAKLLSENSNVVRIMTIHKSKGLEFPVVFLYSCDSDFMKNDLRGNILLHKTAGLGVKFLDYKRKIRYPLVSYEAVKKMIAEDNISEEMRVLYVALTRAKEKLICTASIKDAKKFVDRGAVGEEATSFEALNVSSFAEWIVRGIDENWILEYVSPDEIGVSYFEDDVQEKEDKKAVDFAEVKEIFEYKYPFEKASRLPSKLSVSEVKRHREYESPGETKLYVPDIFEKPTFLSEEKISAAEIGIINHLVLKHIDFKNPAVEDCIEKLVEKGLMSEKEVEFVDVAAISAFFSSDIGKRALKSDEVKRELSFAVNIRADELFSGQEYTDETVVLQGVIDLVFKENDKMVIVDYKTDRFLDAERKKQYFVQLELYEKAVQKIFGLGVSEKYLYMLSKQEMIKADT
ncbi:MAG: 3'-5' exonuclease, partial [Monoglobales bacterium]